MPTCGTVKKLEELHLGQAHGPIRPVHLVRVVTYPMPIVTERALKNPTGRVHMHVDEDMLPIQVDKHAAAPRAENPH